MPSSTQLNTMDEEIRSAEITALEVSPDTRIAEIKARLAAARPGPWRWFGNPREFLWRGQS